MIEWSGSRQQHSWVGDEGCHSGWKEGRVEEGVKELGGNWTGGQAGRLGWLDEEAWGGLGDIGVGQKGRRHGRVAAVDDEVDGDDRVDLLGVAPEAGHGVPHGREVHNRRHPREVGAAPARGGGVRAHEGLIVPRKFGHLFEQTSRNFEIKNGVSGFPNPRFIPVLCLFAKIVPALEGQ